MDEKKLRALAAELAEGHLSGPDGDQGCVEKMEYADPELAAGNEPFYYRVR